MRVAKTGRAQTRWELVVQVITGMTTTIEMGASVIPKTPPKESQLGQGGLLTDQIEIGRAACRKEGRSRRSPYH